MKLAIIVGHLKVAKGARAVAPLSCYEYDYNDVVAELMYKHAKDRGIDCYVYRKDGTTAEYVGQLIDKWNADLCIELHFNAANGSARGTEVLVDEDPGESFHYAAVIQKQLCELFSRDKRGNRGVKVVEAGDRGHRNLKTVKCVSCLVEPAFGDNEDDARLLKMLQNQYAMTLVDASMEYWREAHS
jgi:N-acetylmuramoyl-L-alanine amidase